MAKQNKQYKKNKNNDKDENDYEKDMKKIRTDFRNNIKKISLKDLNPKYYAGEGGCADKIAKISAGKINTNQLRKYFILIKRFELKESWESVEADFYLLRPRLAASVGRNYIPKQFYEFISYCMNLVDKDEDNTVKMKNLKVFINIFESIVAYHKFYTSN